MPECRRRAGMIWVDMYKSGMTGSEIASKLGVPYGRVYYHLRKAGISRPITDYAKLSVLVNSLYQQGLTGEEIANKLGISADIVYRALRFGGGAVRSQSEARLRSGIDTQYFRSIDTKNKAYLFGFLCADAYNSEQKSTIRISLHKQDVSILRYIRSQLHTSTQIREFGNRYCRLDLYSKELSSDLAAHGCVQAKSRILRFPTIHERLVPAFLLGYFDGDGCFSGEGISIVGNRWFVSKYQDRLMNLSGLATRTKPQLRHKHDPDIVSIRYAGSNNVLRIYRTMYSWNPEFCLGRKKHKIENYLRRKGKI